MAEKATLLEARERPRGQPKQFGNGRRDAMLAINEALILQEKGKDKLPEPEHGPGSVLPRASGMPAALPGATPDYDAPPPPPETAEERKIREAQEELLGKEAAERLREEQAKEEARKQTLLGIGQDLLDGTREGVGQLGGGIASIPTPGSLAFPLVLLLLFFFILITYGGHTRLQWAWLVLTGNAQFNLGGQSQVSPASAYPAGSPQATGVGGTSVQAAPSLSNLSASGVPHVGGQVF